MSKASKASSDKLSILLIDDEPRYRENFTKICSKIGNPNNLYDVFTTGLGKQGFEIIDKNNAEERKTLAFIDIILPDINGDELIEEKRNEYKFIHGVLISAHKTINELNEIQKKHPWIKEVYSKPIKNDITYNIVNRFTSNTLKNITHTKSSGFEYYNYDKETTSFLQKEAVALKLLIEEKQWHMKKTIEKTLEMGQKLSEIRNILTRPGEFDEWISKELSFNRSTTYNTILVWEAFGHRQEIIPDSGMSITNLYVLASPSSSEELRSKIFELTASGEDVTVKMIKQLKKTYERKKLLNEREEEEETIFSIPSIDVESKPDGETINTSDEAKDSQQLIETKKDVQEIVKIVKKSNTNNFHSLGRHLLFCGSPNDPKFIEKCPKKVSLNIAFSEDLDRDTNILFPVRSLTKLLFQSSLNTKDIDIITLTEIIQKSIEIYTEGKDTLLFSNLPYPKLLLLAHKLECHCLIAEPNADRAKRIISIWKRFTK